MTIDIYTHFLPPTYAKLLAQVSTVIHPDAGEIGELMRLFPNLCELDTRLHHMDQYDVSVQVLTPLPIPVEQFVPGCAPERAAELIQWANDAMAETVSQRPDRFTGVALLSFQDIDMAVEELVRTVREHGMKGAMIFTNIDGRPLDSHDLFPLYQKAVELNVPLWLHPVSWKYYEWVRDHLIWQIFGWPFDTTLAMARMVYGGIMEMFPTLKVITHHSGGIMPYLTNRIADIYDQTEEFRVLYSKNAAPKEDATRSNSKTPLDYFHQFYNDVALSGWRPALECSYAFFGSSQLVFGSDYPFSPEKGERFLRTNLAAVRDLQLPSSERAKILVENAKFLLNIA